MKVKLKKTSAREVEEKEGHGFSRVEALIREVTTGVEYLKKILGVA